MTANSRSENPLERVHEARSLLDLAVSVDEIERLVKDWQEQMHLYTREASDADGCVVLAGEIKVRSSRRIGEILTQQNNRGGGDPRHRGSDTPGVSKDQRKQARKLAAIPQETFDDIVDDMVAKGKAPTIGAVLTQAQIDSLPSPTPSPLAKAMDAMYRWDQMVLDADVEDIVAVVMEFPEQRGINGAHYRRVAVKLVEVADALEASGRKRMKVISRGA
jgi:hypothetical protein